MENQNQTQKCDRILKEPPQEQLGAGTFLSPIYIEVFKFFLFSTLNHH